MKMGSRVVIVPLEDDAVLVEMEELVGLVELVELLEEVEPADDELIKLDEVVMMDELLLVALEELLEKIDEEADDEMLLPEVVDCEEVVDGGGLLRITPLEINPTSRIIAMAATVKATIARGLAMKSASTLNCEKNKRSVEIKGSISSLEAIEKRAKARW
jgi:hypothetical protein